MALDAKMKEGVISISSARYSLGMGRIGQTQFDNNMEAQTMLSCSCSSGARDSEEDDGAAAMSGDREFEVVDLLAREQEGAVAGTVAGAGVGPSRYCPPRHPTHFQPLVSRVKINGVLRCGKQYLPGPRWGLMGVATV